MYANVGGGGITDRAEYINYLSRVRHFGDFEKMSADGKKEFAAFEGMSPYEFNKYNRADFEQTWFFNIHADFKMVEHKDRRDYALNFINNQLLYGNTVVMYDGTKKDENVTVQEVFKSTKITRKIAESHQIHQANDIDAIKANEIKEKMRKSPKEITEVEQYDYKKYRLNQKYDTATNADNVEWYKHLNDASKLRQFENMETFFDEPDNRH
jgi:hypothetical protein